MEKEYLVITNFLLDIEDFTFEHFYSLINLYGKNSVYNAFFYIKNRIDDVKVLDKFSIAFISIDLDNEKISVDTYYELIEKYGFTKVYDYFKKILLFDNEGKLKEKYEVIYGLINKEEEGFAMDSFSSYLNEISKYKPLSPSEEVLLFAELNRLRRSINIAKFDDDDNICFYDINKIMGIIKNKKQLKLIKCIMNFMHSNDKKCISDNIDSIKKSIEKSNDIQKNEYLESQLKNILNFFEVRERIINSNLILVVAIARLYKNFKYEPLDLIMEGNKGLIRAIQKFDINMGNKFSTYASKWIKQKIGLYILNRTIYIPYHIEEKIHKYNVAIDELSKSYVTLIDNKAIANYLGWDEKMVMEVQEAISKINLQSLDAPLIDEKDSTTFVEGIEDKNINVADSIEKKCLRENINEIMLETLTKKEITVLEHRFGLNGQQAKTLNATGNILGMTHEGVRRIERRAIEKVKKNKKAKVLKEFL